MLDGCVTPFPSLPPELLARQIGLREERAEDADFLRALYMSVRWEEVAPLPWSGADKVAFLSEQSAFQLLHYRRHYAGAAFGILTQASTPIGRLYLHQGASDLRIIDISLLAEHRGGGIGSGVIEAVFAQARDAGIGVTIHVETFNHKARRLYERLGFRAPDGQEGVHVRMEWHPSAPGGDAQAPI